MSVHDDEILGKAYDSRLMRRLIEYLRPYKTRAGFALVAIVAAVAFQLAQPILVKRAIDEYIASGDLAGVGTVALLYLGTLVGAFVAEFVQTTTLQMIGQRIMYDMRREVYDHLQRLDLAVLRPQSGRAPDDARDQRRRCHQRPVHVRCRVGVR